MVTYIGTFSKTQELLAGKRVTKRSAYIAKGQLGKIVSSPVIQESTEFLLLSEKGFGNLVSIDNTKGLFIAEIGAGRIIKQDGLGFSGIGVGYIPENAEAKVKEVRRWPRNWYGDNIKS